MASSGLAARGVPGGRRRDAVDRPAAAWFGRRSIPWTISRPLPSGCEPATCRLARRTGQLRELRDLSAVFNAMAADVEESHAELAGRARHDPLKGLANRGFVYEYLAREVGAKTSS